MVPHILPVTENRRPSSFSRFLSMAGLMFLTEIVFDLNQIGLVR
jgi:hypothetical protein